MGNVDIYHSRRTHYAECYYWLRDENETVYDLNKLVMQNKASGSFYAKESSIDVNNANRQSGVIDLSRNTITLETEDDISDIKRNSIVLYNGKPWMVNSIQGKPHRKESQFCEEVEYTYYLELRR